MNMFYADYIYGNREDAYKKAESLNQFSEDYVVRMVNKNYYIEKLVKEVPPFRRVPKKLKPESEFKNPIITLEI